MTDPPVRRKRVLLPTVLILGLVIVTFMLFSNFWSDLLWFDSVSKTSVFTTLLQTRFLLFVVFGLVMGVGVWLSLWVAYRVRPAYRGTSPEQLSLERYRQSFDPARRPVFVIVPILLGLLGGISASSEWRTYLLWRNGVPFNVTDPQFNRDVSFFTFDMPFQRFVIGYLMTVLVLGIIGALVVQYIYGGIKLQTPGQRTTPAARAQLSLLLGLFLLLKAWSYWLDRFELEVKEGSLITGLTYTDVNAVLPAKTILMWIAVVFPAPFAPSRPTTSPLPTVKLKSSTAAVSPKRRRRFSTIRTGSDMPYGVCPRGAGQSDSSQSWTVDRAAS